MESVSVSDLGVAMIKCRDEYPDLKLIALLPHLSYQVISDFVERGGLDGLVVDKLTEKEREELEREELFERHEYMESQEPLRGEWGDNVSSFAEPCNCP